MDAKKKYHFNYNVIKSKIMALWISVQVSKKSSCKQQRRDLSCNHNNGDVFTCEDSMLFSRAWEDMKFSRESSLGISLLLIPWRKLLHFVSLNPHEQNYFFRSPVSSDEEAIYVKGNHNHLHVKAYISALLASGFSQNDTAFTPCPLGTFTNPLTKGVDGCQKCPPGNFKLLLWIQRGDAMCL